LQTIGLVGFRVVGVRVVGIRVVGFIVVVGTIVEVSDDFRVDVIVEVVEGTAVVDTSDGVAVDF
jgi:hypothetical protein